MLTINQDKIKKAVAKVVNDSTISVYVSPYIKYSVSSSGNVITARLKKKSWSVNLESSSSFKLYSTKKEAMINANAFVKKGIADEIVVRNSIKRGTLKRIVKNRSEISSYNKKN